LYRKCILFTELTYLVQKVQANIPVYLLPPHYASRRLIQLGSINGDDELYLFRAAMAEGVGVFSTWRVPLRSSNTPLILPSTLALCIAPADRVIYRNKGQDWRPEVCTENPHN